MARPNAAARSLLDEAVRDLSQVSGGVKIDDFRTQQQIKAQRIKRFIKYFIVTMNIVFVAVAVITLIFPSIFGENNNSTRLARAATWSIALGGLGAVASVFLHLLRMLPQETLRDADGFEVVGRVLLGCLFSLVLAITILAPDMIEFFTSLEARGGQAQTSNPQGGVRAPSGVSMLAPFLAGYSMVLVLGILEKATQALQLTLSLDDRREPAKVRSSRA